jgi:hypothetical protein
MSLKKDYIERKQKEPKEYAPSGTLKEWFND